MYEKRFNEYELLYMLRMGDEYAQRVLFLMYQNYVCAIARSVLSDYPFADSYTDDIYAEAQRTIFLAADTYNNSRNASFKTYLSQLVKRKCQNYIRKFYTKDLLNSRGMIALDAFVYEKYSSLQDASVHYELTCPEYYTDYKISLDHLNASVEKFSGLEKKILKCMLENRKYSEAAEDLGITVKKYDSLVQKVRKKIKQAIQA